MGRSLQLLTQVGRPHLQCVSPPSSSWSLSAPLLRTPISTRRSARRNVVVSWKGSALTTDLATHQGTGPAMAAMNVNTTARAELTTTTREKLKPKLTRLQWLKPNLLPTLILTPSTGSTGTGWGTLMVRAPATTVIPWDMRKASTAMDLDTATAMVGATFSDQPAVYIMCFQ